MSRERGLSFCKLGCEWLFWHLRANAPSSYANLAQCNSWGRMLRGRCRAFAVLCVRVRFDDNSIGDSHITVLRSCSAVDQFILGCFSKEKGYEDMSLKCRGRWALLLPQHWHGVPILPYWEIRDFNALWHLWDRTLPFQSRSTWHCRCARLAEAPEYKSLCLFPTSGYRVTDD